MSIATASIFLVCSCREYLFSSLHFVHILKSKVSSCRQHTAAAAKTLQSCPTLCDSTDSSPPGSSVPGIPQARTLERVAISFSNAWKWKVKVKSLSPVWLFVTPQTAACLAPPPMGVSRQESWSGLPVGSYFLIQLICAFLLVKFNSFASRFIIDMCGFTDVTF